MNDEWVKIQRILIGYFFNAQDKKFLSLCVERFKPEHFTERREMIWKIINKYFMKTSCVLTIITLREMFRNHKTSENMLLEFESEVETCMEAAKSINSNDMPYYFDVLVAVYKQVKLKDALIDADLKLKNDGFSASRDSILTSLSKIDVSEGECEPDRPISDSMEDFIRRTKEIKNNPVAEVNTGFRILDANIGGLCRGDVFLVAGFTSVGKTGLMMNFTYDIVYKQKKTVVYITTETIKAQVIRRLVSRMSRDKEIFETPIASRDLKSGKLSEKELLTLDQIKNMMNNTSSGRMIPIQAPVNASLDWVRGKLLQLESQYPIDVVILDEIRHMKASSRRNQEWEEFNDMMKSVKGIARTHAGKGVVIISPYQVGRVAYQYALQNDGKYNLTSLSSSAEAERTSDVVMTLWEELDQPGIIRAELLKMRDGAKGAVIPLVADFAFQYLYERDSMASSGGFSF